MGAINLSNFGGLRPIISPRLLPDNGAQIAANCRLSSGELVPLKAPSLAYTSTKMGNMSAIYRAVAGSQSAWLAWTDDVDVVKAPLAVSATQRWCYTGDGEPKVTTIDMATFGGGNNYPSTYYALGIPAPITKATVTPSGGTGSATTRFYCYTFFSQWGEESAPCQVTENDGVTGKVDDTWAISGMDAVPPNSGDITALTFVGSSVTITTTNSHYNRAGDSVTVAGVTTVTNVNGTWVLTAVNTASKTMTFTVSGTPAGTYVDATDAADTWTRVAPWNTTGMKRRLYRTTGTLGGWQLVDDDVSTSHNDTLSDAALPGDALISDGWEPPTPYLDGIILLPSGSAVGFYRSTLYVSEPYQLHAWTTSFNTEQDIVGICAYGNNVIVGTRGVPYMLSGTEPASMSLTRTDLPYPCLSKRSMVSLGYGVAYATGLGFVIVGDAAPAVMTKDVYSVEQWKSFNPETMFALANGVSLILNYLDDTGLARQLIFENGIVTTSDFNCHDMISDADTGDIYVSSGATINRWDYSATTNMYQTWRSKEIQIPTPMSLGAFKIIMRSRFTAEEIAARAATIAAAQAANAVIISGGGIGGSVNAWAINAMRVNGSTLSAVPPELQVPSASFSIYIDGELRYSVAASDNRMQRIPQLGKYDRVAFEVTSNAEIQSIVAGDTPGSLRTA